MPKKPITREALLESFSTLAEKFNQSLVNAQELEQRFDASRTRLLQSIFSRLQNSQSILPSGNPLQETMSSFVATMEAVGREWDDQVLSRQKGIDFRKGFEDSLLVFVNGKVKSGKSSLGNYMAWGHTDPTDELKCHVPSNRTPFYQSHQRTEVKSGDQENEAFNKREFRVGATEATSSIQSFSLPGLTWVDSPGLHSLNEKNGNLAEEYRAHADLVLYAMHSDSPGRASDLEEIEELSQGGKRVLLLLTGSDTTGKPVIDNGKRIRPVIMKSIAVRQEQQDYVRHELQALTNSGNLEIVSISARYAQIHADDPAALQDSGMTEFFSTLQDICQSEGVKIKQRVPMNNLHNFLKSCEENRRYKSAIDSFNPILKNIESKLQRGVPIHIQGGQKEIKVFINAFFDRLENKRNDAIFINRSLEKFKGDLVQKFQDIAVEKLHAITHELSKDFQSGIASTLQKFSLPEVQTFKLDMVTEQVATGVRSGTKRRNSGIGSVLGGLVGAFFGPVGIAIGSGVGGVLGGVSGDSARVSYKEIQITVGDNLHEIRKNILQTQCNAFEVILQKISENLWQEFNSSTAKLLNDILNDIALFNQELQSILKKTQATH